MAEKPDMLDGLRSTANEAFSGLHASEGMRQRILASKPKLRRSFLKRSVFAPAACCLLILVITSTVLRGGKRNETLTSLLSENLTENLSDDLPDNSSEAGEEAMPMLLIAEDEAENEYDESPRLSARNAAEPDSDSTAVLLSVEDSQEFANSTAAAFDTLLDELDIRGQIQEMSLDSIGTLTGETAEQVFLILTEKAQPIDEVPSADSLLTFVLRSGLTLQLAVAGDTVIACGAWRCPEFFSAFRSATKAQ